MINRTDTSQIVHDDLVSFIQERTDVARLIKHPPCKTSKESMECRASASGEYVTGAKALLIKIDTREDVNDVFAVVIIPGFNRLDSKVLKKELRARIPNVRNFRFATPQEMERMARGMQPGKMPPFGKPLFPRIDYTFIDKALLVHDKIGFNAADFEQSFIMSTSEYMRIVTHNGIFSCSVEVF